MTTPLSEATEALEALRPVSEELARLIRSGHDLQALAPRIQAHATECDRRQDAYRVLVLAYCTDPTLSDRDEIGHVAGYLDGSWAVYNAIVATGHCPDELELHGIVITQADADELADARWDALLN